MKTFTINPEENHIPLNDLMKVLSWATSGGEAKQTILGGEVQVNGKPEARIRKKIHKGDIVSFMGNEVEII